MRLRWFLALLASLALLAASCGSDDSSDDAGTETDADSADGEGESSGGGSSGPAVDIDAALAADLDSCEEAPTGDPIKVGMAMDFSEASGFVDIPGSKVVPYLAELINCVGGVDGAPVEVLVRDVQGDPETASLAAQELVDWGAHFMIGPPFADFGLPILQTAEGKVATFMAASTEPSLPDAEANSFLVSFDDTGQSTAAAEWALAEGFERAIVFTDPGPYSGYNPDVFAEAFEAGGGTVVSTQTYGWFVDTDFSAQANEVAGLSENDEVVFSAMAAFQLTALRGQLEGQGLDGLTYVGTDALDATGIAFEDNNEGIVHTPHIAIEDGGRNDLLLKGYAAAKGDELESLSFMGLYADSMLLGIQAVADCGCTDTEGVGEAVSQITGFEGFSGEMSYAGTNGLPEKKVPIKQIVDGVDTLIASQ